MKLVDVRCCPGLKLWWLSGSEDVRFYPLIGLFWAQNENFRGIKLVMFCLALTIFVGGNNE